MSGSEWEDGLRLDAQLGPARPLPGEDAERMVQAALDEMAPARRPIRGARWGWALAAAIALFVLAPAAIAGFQTYILPALPSWRSAPPKPKRPAARTPPPETVIMVEPEPVTEPPLTEPRAAEPSTPPAPRPAKATPRRRRRVQPPAPRSAPWPRPTRPLAVEGPDELLARANRLRAARAYDEATLAYAEVRKRFPGSGPAYVAAVAEGQLWLRPNGDPRKAITAFEAAAGIRPNGPLDAEILFGRGSALWALNRRRSARRVWRKLIDRYPSSAPARRADTRLKTP